MIEHQVARSFVVKGRRVIHTATCTCGWTDTVASLTASYDAAAAHLKEASR